MSFTLRRFVDTCLSTCEAIRSGNENAEQGRVYSPTYKDVLGTHWRILVCHNFKSVQLDDANAASKLRLSKSPVHAVEGQNGPAAYTLPVLNGKRWIMANSGVRGHCGV